MVTLKNWRAALAVLCVLCAGVFALGAASAVAQVDWVTTLNGAQVPVALTQQTVADSGDGAVYVAAIGSDGESNRVRLARVSSSGVEQWSRWVTGSYAGARLPLFVHPDSSATLVYQVDAVYFCLHNFSAAGVSRSRVCFGNAVATSRVALAADGDLFVALSGALSRTYKKLSPTGVERWSQISPAYLTGLLSGYGVDSAGNYFEVQDGLLRSWSSVDGRATGEARLSGFNWVANSPTGRDAIARAGRDVVLISGTAALANAVAVSVSRYATTGAVVWTQQVIFPGANNGELMTLLPGDGDAVYLTRTPSGLGDAHIAKLSATGAILWQRHHAGIRRVIEGSAGLLAIRTNTSAAPSTDSFAFAVSPSDGALGAPATYSRNDAFAPNEWFAVGAGVVGVFQGGNPFSPSAAYPLAVAATTAFVSATVGGSWQNVAQRRAVASVTQSDCLMPRMARSSPSGWWGRTQTALTGSGAADWTTIFGASGAVAARTAAPALGCGAPITSDGGRTVVSPTLSDRVKKIDAAGASVWQTPSTLNPVSTSAQPLQSLTATNELTYMVGSVMGRVSATGTLLFETETNRTSPRFLAVDSANNAWLVSGGSGPSAPLMVTKVSSTGALLWSSTVMTPACSEVNLVAKLLPSDEMLLATQSCQQPSLYKINGTGAAAWQRNISGSTRPRMFFSALNADAAGNIYAGGCASSGARASTGSDGLSVMMSLTAAGADRWTVQSELIAEASECVTSIAIDGTDTLYAAVSSSDATRAPVLWSLTGAGVERWRHGNVLNSPLASLTELAVDSAGSLIALGEAPPGLFGARETSMRRINVASIASTPLNIKFLQVPSAPIGYREPFAVSIGLRTVADTAINATVPVVVNLARQNGTGVLDGTRTCTIAVGTSECVISDSRYNVVQTGVTLTASADGFAAVTSAAISFTAATTVTTISALTPGPYTAFSVIRVRAAVQAPAPPSPAVLTGFGTLNGPTVPPSAPSAATLVNCVQGTDAVAAAFTECDLLLRAANMPLSAGFVSFGNGNYLSSTAAPTSFAFNKVAPTLLITNDPTNTYVVGDRLRFRVAVMVPGGVNASSLIALNTLTVSGGGSCAAGLSSGALFNGFAGSYLLCEITQPAAGPLTVNFSFAGDTDLLPAGPVPVTTTIVSGGVLRGTGTTFPSGVTLCSTEPSVTCGFIGGYSQWQCTGPAGMSGQVYFLSAPGAGQYHFPTAPLSFSNVTGLTAYTAPIPFAASTRACQLDVDGDGARMTLTDGILVMRRMLNLTGNALTDRATHACVPRTAVAIAQAINLPSYDIDGDGFTLPHTDGLLLLRAMLGLRGEALINGAVAPTALRKTAQDIQAFLTTSCGHAFN
jgi:hypothetical protein